MTAGKRGYLAWSLLGLIAAALFAGKGIAQTPPEPDSEPATRRDVFCLTCHANSELRLPDPNAASLYVDEEAYARSKHGRAGISCMECHPRMGRVPHARRQPLREINREIVKEQCSRCHEGAYAAYRNDVHGRVFVDGSNLDVASCTDCHGVHDMTDTGASAFRLTTTDACSKCHADRVMMEKYGVSTSAVAAYEADFHGLSTRLARSEAGTSPRWAVCTDCHGAHSIKGTKDPGSSVSGANLINACRACHDGATPQFTLASSGHADLSSDAGPSYWARRFYDFAIPGAIGPMFLYMALETIRLLLARRAGSRAR